MKKIFSFGILVLIFLSIATSSPVYALKKRIRAPKPAGVGYTSVRIARPSHSAVITFYPQSNVKRFDYSLSYAANGIDQGVMGSFVPSGTNGESRDLYFGTCSHGVCTPHYGITGATLTVTTTLTNGSSYIKRYRLKNI